MTANRITIVVTLTGELVDHDKFQSYSFPENTRSRALEIVKDSIYPYPVKSIIVVNTDVEVVLEGSISIFQKVLRNKPSHLENEIIKDIINNYGDGGPDTWMEGNILIDDIHELWLYVTRIKFYKNDKLYLSKNIYE